LEHCFTDASGMDFRAMLKKKKYAKNQLDDQGPDWGDLKPVEVEPAPVLKKTDKVSSHNFQYLFRAKTCPLFQILKKSQNKTKQKKSKKKRR
jgi:hypothetical protein